VRRDVTYATTTNGPLTLDVYRSAGARAPSPVLIFLHGGGWIMGSKHDALPEVYRAPSYGDRTWPSMLPYVRRGTRRRQSRLPAGRRRFRARRPWTIAGTRSSGWERMGRSTGSIRGVSSPSAPPAGGHLALMTAFDADSRVRVRGAIDLYGITDVPPLLATPDVRPWASEWIGNGADAQALARRMSPLSLVRAGLPPVLIVHSDADAVVPYDQAERLAGALRAAGVSVDLVTLPGGLHGFLTSREHARLEESVLAFLGRVGLLEEPANAAGSPKHEDGDRQRQQAR
jgi:predicted esterase